MKESKSGRSTKMTLNQNTVIEGTKIRDSKPKTEGRMFQNETMTIEGTKIKKNES